MELPVGQSPDLTSVVKEPEVAVRVALEFSQTAAQLRVPRNVRRLCRLCWPEMKNHVSLVATSAADVVKKTGLCSAQSVRVFRSEVVARHNTPFGQTVMSGLEKAEPLTFGNRHAASHEMENVLSNDPWPTASHA